MCTRMLRGHRRARASHTENHLISPTFTFLSSFFKKIPRISSSDSLAQNEIFTLYDFVAAAPHPVL